MEKITATLNSDNSTQHITPKFKIGDIIICKLYNAIKRIKVDEIIFDTDTQKYKYIEYVTGTNYIQSIVYEDEVIKIYEPITNIELQKILKQWPDDAVVAVEYCDIRNIKYSGEYNIILID